MNWSAAAVLALAGVAAGAILAALGACIPDLPADPADAATVFPAPGGQCGDGVIDIQLGEQCDPGPGVGDASVGGCGPDCRMRCASGAPPWPVNNHCYSVISATGVMALMPAALDCAGASHLVTFASEDEFQHVSALASQTRPFWVGLELVEPTVYPRTYGLFEPGWSPGCAGCYAHTDSPDAGLPWYPDASPDAAGGCVGVVAWSDTQQSWENYPCRGLSRQTVEVICELEPVGRLSTPCEAGLCISLVKTYGAKRYVYHADPATADGAAAACAQGVGRLVVLQTRDEREQLWRELAQLTVRPQAVWIGLSQTSPATASQPAVWTWDDGTPSEAAGAYPSEWAINFPLPPNPRTATTRAFVYHTNMSDPPVDDTLARNDTKSLTTMPPGTSLTAPFVCEITADTLAAALDAGVGADAGADADY